MVIFCVHYLYYPISPLCYHYSKCWATVCMVYTHGSGSNRVIWIEIINNLSNSSFLIFSCCECETSLCKSLNTNATLHIISKESALSFCHGIKWSILTDSLATANRSKAILEQLCILVCPCVKKRRPICFYHKDMNLWAWTPFVVRSPLP